MKKVLVISYYWPPSGGSGVQRWVKMCKYLPLYGWQSVVYTPENPALTSTDGSLGTEVPAEVEVLRRKILEPGQFARKSTGSQVNPINAGKKTLKQRMAMWIRGNCFIPDPRVLWVGPSVKFLSKYLKENHIDAIVSTGPPHSMHLIAKRLAARTSIPWIADFRDPWTGMFYFKHLCLTGYARKRHLKLEKSVLDSATVLVAVSPMVRDDFAGMTSTPVELITNGFDESDFDIPAVVDVASGATDVVDGIAFTILHAGLFSSDGNPEAVWEALAKMVSDNAAFASCLRIVLCGKTDREILASIENCGLGPYLDNRGYLDHSRVVRLLPKASVLLLPLRKEPEYRATLPGKLFEYLAARRPIIGIGQKDGAMAQILSGCGAGEMFEWDETQAIYDCLSEKFRKFQSRKLADNDADLSIYTRKGIAARYARLLDSVVKSKQ